MMEAARAAEDAMGSVGTSMRGLVRVSVPVTFSQMFLAPVVAVFQREHPDVEVHLIANDAFVDAVASEFDLVIRVARIDDGAFVAKKLASDRLVVAGSPAYLAEHGRPLRPEDLVHHNCLRYLLVDAQVEWKFRGADRRPPCAALEPSGRLAALLCTHGKGTVAS